MSRRNQKGFPPQPIPILAVEYRYLTPMKWSTDNGFPLMRDTQ